MSTDSTSTGAPIVRAEIHPAVGIMRVGTSEEHYLGPEVTPLAPTDIDSMRDADGNLKRQAVRFRAYGYDAEGNVVRELGPDEVAWSVHVANHKAAWYDWAIALDIPEADGTACPRRNATVVGPDRDGLAIDAGLQSISSSNPVDLEGQFQVGTADAASVSLGSAWTDEDGRLVVLAAKGVSASPDGAPIFPSDKEFPFINADGWYDDVCDGPVTAAVTVGGEAVPCESAWVLSAPPNYAPDVVSLRTLFDLLVDLYVQAGWMTPPSPVEFGRDVLPIFRRFSRMGWVNQAFAVQYGLDGPFPFDDDAFIARLRHPGEETHELRRQVFNQMRAPAAPSPDPIAWPWVYGDAMDRPARGGNERQNATLSPTQYTILEQWAAGEFVDSGDRQPPTSLEAIPLQHRPAVLTRSALEDALADAFHPGCEVTWPVRNISMWAKPFRLRHRPADTPAPDYGQVLTTDKALADDGPLHEQGPGDLTRWMGLPWQADSAFCRSGYDTDYDPYVPTFWPATVPNQVLAQSEYEVLMDTSASEEARKAAFASRAAWIRYLPTLEPNEDPAAYRTKTMQAMVDDFGGMGVVLETDGPGDVPGVPAKVQVEVLGPPFAGTEPEPAPESLAAAPGKPSPKRPTPAGATFESHEAAKAAPLPVTHKGQS